MKKWIILIIIWILALGGIFIYSKTIKFDENIIKPPVKEKENLSKFQYIDYTDYYNENDLKVEKIKFSENNSSNYIKISGLKDKELEEKLNKKFYDEANKILSESSGNVNSNLSLNAFNILSFYVETYNSKSKPLYYNIDLTTGDEIKMNDILNTTNITNILASNYYEAVADSLASRYGYDVASDKRNTFLEDIDNQELKNYIGKLEDDTLEYARNFDYNSEFYMTSAGIFISSNYKDLFNTRIRLFIDENPRLFNYFYKYKTKESIFDGSYTGKKNLMYAEYMRRSSMLPASMQVLDNAVVHKLLNFESNIYPSDESVFETPLFKNYLDSLDKNKFYYIDKIETGWGERDYIDLTQCTMTKEFYNNEYKKYLANQMINKDVVNSKTGYYNLRKDGVNCETITLFFNNPNVYSNSWSQGNNARIYIRNNSEKTAEINSYIETTIDKLKKEYPYAYISNFQITENQIIITINSREVITKVFDL
nr:hypothetical protein [Bacilli bacterium]